MMFLSKPSSGLLSWHVSMASILRTILHAIQEALRFACNAVCIGRHVVLPTGCPETMELLSNQGYQPHQVELNEFLKAGGSAKCLTLALD